MKILLYGEAESIGSGAWCYAETLREMGHEVSSVDPWLALEHYRTSLFWSGLRRIVGAIREGDRIRHVRALRERAGAERPDIIIILKGLLLGAGEIQDLKEIVPWVVNINHDDFFSSNPNNWSMLQREAIPSYDYIFCTREINVTEVLPINPKAEFFPFAYYPRIHHHVQLSAEDLSEWQCDVIFVGTYAPSRMAMLEALVKRVPAKYAIFGGRWQRAPRRSNVKPYIKFRELLMVDMARALGAAKIALGFLREENRDDYTQRTFEIPACGGVLLAERTLRHLSYFREGYEAEFFEKGSVDELCSKVCSLLTDDPRREAIRHAGGESLRRQGHTYRDRMQQLLTRYHPRRQCSRS